MIYNPWKDNEIEYLRENYKRLGARAVSISLGRSIDCVHSKWIYINKPKRIRKDAWTEEELTILRDKYEQLGSVGVAAIINRSPASIGHKAMRIGLPIQASDGYRNRIALRLRLPSSTQRANCISSWRKLVKERDDFTCQKCGLHEPLIVTAHHIIQTSDGGDKFAVDNGVTLCPNCHALDHAKNKKVNTRHHISKEDINRIKELHDQRLGYSEIAGHLHVNIKTVQAVMDAAK